MLVDTCVWIDFFNGAETKESAALRTAFRVCPEQVFLCDIVYMEMLVGFPMRERRRFEVAREFIGNFQTLQLRNRLNAVQIVRRLRELGITLRGFQNGLLDVIIAQTAIDHSQQLLTANRFDFENIRRVSDLTLVEV